MRSAAEQTAQIALIGAPKPTDKRARRLRDRVTAYAWAANKGYGTPDHLTGLRRVGLSPHHRVAFCRTALGGQLAIDDEVANQGARGSSPG